MFLFGPCKVVVLLNTVAIPTAADVAVAVATADNTVVVAATTDAGIAAATNYCHCYC